MANHQQRGHRLVAVLLFFALLGCNRSPIPTYTTITGQTMGTGYQVSFRLPDTLERDQVARTIQGEVDRIDGEMSNWKPDSDVSRFNAFESSAPFELSPETANVVRISLDIAARTGGAFDPTLSPLIELWGFGTRDRTSFPQADEISRTLKRVGYENLSLDGRRLSKGIADLELNLSAIAKGFAVDCVANALESHGIRDYMVDIGGEVRVLGENAEGGPWRIGLEAPQGRHREPQIHHVALATSGAIATSGNYRNFFTHEGRLYTHIIDPRSGVPIGPRVSAATVLADECVTADALATALMVMEPRQGLALVDATEGVECLLVQEGTDLQQPILMSAGMHRFLKP